MADEKKEMTFLDHLEALRWHLVRSVIVVCVLGVVLFCFPDFLFGTLIFGPKHEDFLTYRALCKLSHLFNMGESLCIRPVQFELMNPELSGQFMTHMWIAFVGGLVGGIPYVLWEIWRFVKPALKPNEIRYTRGFVFYATLLFLIGVLFSYYIIVPLTVNFLGGYQVTREVVNRISMDSYISSVTTLVLLTGIIFELPILIFFLTKFGIVTPAFMRKYRRHAIVVNMILAAFITPSSDIPTMLLVFAPLQLLYELSIFVSKYELRKQKNS